jgi:hypothetical protein
VIACLLQLTGKHQVKGGDAVVLPYLDDGTVDMGEHPAL